MNRMRNGGWGVGSGGSVRARPAIRGPHSAVGVLSATRLVFAAAVALVGLAILARPERAAAHPLGNFTINRYARVEPGAQSVRVVYALDMAEIPTFQEMGAIDRDKNGTVSEAERDGYLGQKLPEIARNLRLSVNGAPLALAVESGSLRLSEGQGGLSVLRIDAAFVAELPAGARGGRLAAQLRDTNYDNRLGWKEIVVRGTEGAAVRESSVAAVDVSDALRSYPDDALSSPLEVREARFSFEPGVADAAAGRGATNAAGRAAARTARASGAGILSRFADSAATRDLTAPVILFSLMAAMFWGALHALGPGHGKTVVAAYLVGSRGTARHAVFLGLTVTATHTAGVYLLGFVTLTASHFIVPERLYPILSLASGLVVIGMGLSLLAGRLRGLRNAGRVHGHDHSPEHGHDHAHEHGHDGQQHLHGHSHAVPGMDGTPVTWRSLLALGVYGGLIPCPTAIVVLLTSISLDRIGFGLMLVVAFSAGLAAVLTGVGLMLVYAGRVLSRVKVRGGIARAVPVMSAAAVILAGVLITLRAVGQTGLPGV
jgi:nickel/cobalt exporter